MDCGLRTGCGPRVQSDGVSRICKAHSASASFLRDLDLGRRRLLLPLTRRTSSWNASVTCTLALAEHSEPHRQHHSGSHPGQHYAPTKSVPIRSANAWPSSVVTCRENSCETSQRGRLLEGSGPTLSTLLPTMIFTTSSAQYVSISRNHLMSSSNVFRAETS